MTYQSENIKPNIAVILTCFNRKEKTLRCIKSLADSSNKSEIRFVVVDDNSTDGTKEALEELSYDIKIIDGNGQLFWCGGMYTGLQYVLENETPDYVFFVNDDVAFYPSVIDRMLDEVSKGNFDSISEKDVKIDTPNILVGTTCDTEGKVSYGGVVLTSKHLAKFDILDINQKRKCDTFNCNCVLVPFELVKKIGNFDSKYTHSMGDFDYGLRASRCGYVISNTDYYVGECDTNSEIGTWKDISLPRKERLKLKETRKGLPKNDWWHFCKKNFGVLPAIYHSITPYIRILIKK